ncbi:MAG: hypothetical protein IT199_06425, partial [Solirubrobacterales bacterium]|nr:hypothetical protein [Solirubrobacterales bacterium]
LAMFDSTAAVTAGTLTVNGAATGLMFGNNPGASFTATGATNLSNITGTGVDLQGGAGTYSFADLNVGITGASTGLDFRNANVLFTAASTTITGDGTAGSIAVDLSGSLNPNGANSAVASIQLANAAGQTAIINNVATGVLLGNILDGSAGANFIYGNQTPLNSGSQINVIGGGLTLDTTNLVSTNTLTQGQYNFVGVGFTGLASFQESNDLLFVGSTSSGADNGATPQDRISIAELLALDANPSNLDGKRIVLVNDNGGAGLDLGANTLTLGDSTILDSFGNGNTISAGSGVPVNVIVDTIASPLVYSDPNGAATLTNDGSLNVVTLGNGDTIQNLILVGGTNTIFGSGIAGANINNNVISGSSLAAISLNNTTGVIGLTQNAISGTGTDGIELINAGTVTVSGGTINGTGGDGIQSTDTNLTATGLNIGGTGTISGDGISISNNIGAHTVDVSNNTIRSSDHAIFSSDGGPGGQLVLTLDGNTLESTGGFAMMLASAGSDATIVKSMNGGTVIGNGTGPGVFSSGVTFDASGTALTGTQVDAGDWTIGTAANRVLAMGLALYDPTGDLKFGTLNIASDFGTGLIVDTTSSGTTFNLATAAGTVDTTNGDALFLDTFSAAMTLTAVNSTNGGTHGATLDTVGGTISIGSLNVTGASGSGLLINNSSGLTSTITTVGISSAGGDGVLLIDAGTVGLLGGTIDGNASGITSIDTNLTATGLNIGGAGTMSGIGILIGNTTGAHTVDISNNTIKSAAMAIMSNDSGTVGELVLTLDGNTLETTGGGNQAMLITGSALNSTIIRSMNGGTVIGGANSGGVLFNQVTFDASGTALSGTQVAAGNWTIGTNAARVQGDGLRFDAPTGDLAFGTLNVSNNAGTGLYVDTKTLGTTFSLSNTGGAVDTTAGAALFLDPLATNLTFGTVSSADSSTTGATFSGVTGSVNITSLNVTNAAGDGVVVTGSTAGITVGTVDVNGASTGLNFSGNTGTSFTVTGATTLSNLVGTGVDMSGASGTFSFQDLTVTTGEAQTALDFRNSNLMFASANTSLTGDGSALSIAVDLSGSQNPTGANSTTPNIQLANAPGQTALINNFEVGILMGNIADGSAGANFVYGNQTPLNSGSQINVIGGGLTLDATNLTSTDPFTQGRYEFKG